MCQTFTGETPVKENVRRKQDLVGRRSDWDEGLTPVKGNRAGKRTGREEPQMAVQWRSLDQAEGGVPEQRFPLGRVHNLSFGAWFPVIAWEQPGENVTLA